MLKVKRTGYTSQVETVYYQSVALLCAFSVTDRPRQTESVDQFQRPQNLASDQGLHCMQLIQQYFRHMNR